MGGEASSGVQVLSLLLDIICTLISSACFSLQLLLFPPPPPPPPPSSSSSETAASKLAPVTLYEGIVRHHRNSPLSHSFSYNVRYLLVNLDCPPSWFTSAAALHHMRAPDARKFAATTGPVYLLTVPTSVGYEQNPLSVYYCFNEDESCLCRCIAEVTNTPWAERVMFTFDADADVVAKPLHVSPFMDMLGSWRIKAALPGRKLSITIIVEHPEHGNYFTASLTAKQVDYPLRNIERFFWLMPHKTALGIYWQAFLLWWKGVKFCQHPKYIDGEAYQVRAIERDRQLSEAVKGIDENSGCCQLSNVCESGKSENKTKNKRVYWWRRAEWPWM